MVSFRSIFLKRIVLGVGIKREGCSLVLVVKMMY